jgi:hypothetical protein
MLRQELPAGGVSLGKNHWSGSPTLISLGSRARIRRASPAELVEAHAVVGLESCQSLVQILPYGECRVLRAGVRVSGLVSTFQPIDI